MHMHPACLTSEINDSLLKHSSTVNENFLIGLPKQYICILLISTFAIIKCSLVVEVRVLYSEIYDYCVV